MRHQVASRIQVSLKTRENLASPGHCELLSIDVGRLPETVVANRGFARRTEFLDPVVPRVWGKELTFGGTNGTFGPPQM